MIDSHQHFWAIARGDYGWMGQHVAPLLRDFMPEDLAPLMARTGITRTIAVQAADSEAETEFLLQLAERTGFIAGVVGWLDMDSDAFPERLDHLRRSAKFVGLRPMLQDLPDDRFILRPRVLRHLGLMADRGLALDVLIVPRHLPHVREALALTPGLRAVIDHMAKPEIAAGRLDPWREGIAAVAALPDVSCKLSGLVTEAPAGSWTPDHLRPYVDHVVDCFGPDRLMFGSDWPVCTLAATYAEVNNAARLLTARHFGPADMEKLFSTNAARFYLGAAGRS
jgi:L-fuconolactonase